MDKDSGSGSFKAQLAKPPLEVKQFLPDRETPGDVGVCLSGGGSRALTAGMGQLRALKFLTANDKSLLSQVKALSTVSGGSWVGTTFQFLTDPTSDDAYLNLYVPDPSRLVPTQTAGHSVAETLDQLPEGNIGQIPASESFGPVALGLQAVILKILGVPTNMLWQTLIGIHILQSYGLYTAKGKYYLPDSLFSYDQTTLENEVTGPNPELSQETAHLYADALDGNRTPRAYLICNMAMFVTLRGDTSGYQYLTPTQASPFFTGIPGTPDALDANGQSPGGGGATSFAFNSSLAEAGSDQVTVNQSRQWSLTDIVGTSSAFFAAVLENLFAQWREDPAKLAKALGEHEADLRAWIGKRLPTGMTDEVEEFLSCAEEAKETEEPLSEEERKQRELWLRDLLADIKDLVPCYGYWSVLDLTPVANPRTSRFADGGDLENTGIAGMLTYLDIKRLISFVNGTTPLSSTDPGVFGPDGKEIAGTGILVDNQIPPLFGYQPYQKGLGYRLYAGVDEPKAPIYRFNQVFPSEAFPELLKGLWENSGNKAAPGSNALPAVFQQQNLEVLDNPWLGVKGDRQVTVVWVYNNFVQAWYDLLSPDVQKVVDGLVSDVQFPGYSTFRTHLTATEVNALANLSAWVVANDQQASLFKGLFT